MNTPASSSAWDAIVVGGGAAGLSAALILGRARRRVLVIDAGSPRNRFAEHVHGVLGNEGIPPAELVRKGREEAAAYGVEFRDGAVESVQNAADGLTVTVSDGPVERTRALVVAVGIADELPDIPGLAQRWGKSVLHCPYCHGWEVRDQRIGVLATSPMSLHQARLVRQWSDRVVLFSAEIGALDPADERRLRARDIDVVTAPVVEILGDGDQVTGVRTADGRVTQTDAVFTAGAPRPHDGFLVGLDLDRTEQPLGLGSFVTVDPTGRTSHDRVWAIGNVVNPMANVPLAVGAGALTGAAVNGALVEEDFDLALAGHPPTTETPTTAAAFWEARYADADRIWSGRVNRVVAEIAEALEPGRALDLGCGEGGDAVWLARHGWTVTGIDLSATAIERGRAAAAAAGIRDDALQLEAADLATWVAPEDYDLVSASFLQSWPVPIPRDDILRRATGFVAPGGHLLVVAHAAAPSWAEPDAAHAHPFPSPEQDLAALELDSGRWQVVVCETRQREVTGPDGAPASLDDGVVLVRRIR